MTTLPRIRWSDLVTARPDECDPIDDPRIKARVLIVCTLILFMDGLLIGAGAIDYARFLFTTPNLTVTP